MEKPQFVDDIRIKGAYTGILLRSPVVSGILREIKTPQLPGNVSLISADHIPGDPMPFGIPIFPKKELSWFGQPVALLLGPDPALLEQIAQHCEVLADTSEINEKEKLIAEKNYTQGNIEEAFDHPHTVVEGTYTTGIQDPWSSDTPGAIAVPGAAYTMIIHTATQRPGHVRSSVAACLKINPSKVTVKVSRLEIDLDSKVWFPSLLACQAAVGARIINKPVRLILTREEDFLFSPKSVGTEIAIQSALDKQGAILGTRIQISANFGAFGIFADEILDNITLAALSAYNHESVSVEAKGYVNSIPPAGPTMAYGLVQGFYAAEQHSSLIADTLGENPASWRKNAFIHTGLIDAIEKDSDYCRKWAAYELLRKSRREGTAERSQYEAPRGIGIAAAYQGKVNCWGIAVVEAEIDTAAYTSKIRGIWLVLEGKINSIIKRSAAISAMQALSWAMQENLVYQNGRISGTSVLDYPIFAEEVPQAIINFIGSDSKSHTGLPGNTYGAAILAFSTIPAAYTQALSQALDSPFQRYPADSQAIWKALCQS